MNELLTAARKQLNSVVASSSQLTIDVKQLLESTAGYKETMGDLKSDVKLMESKLWSHEKLAGMQGQNGF